jgi:hypothetical protein
MKAEKRARLIQEAVAAGRRDAERDRTFATIDLMTGLTDGPAVFSFPVDSYGFIREGRYRINLAELGYRLERL